MPVGTLANFFKVELKLVPTGIKDQHNQLGMEALNTVEDSIQGMYTAPGI